MKAVIIDPQTTSLFVYMQIYGYKPEDLPVASYIAFMPNTTKLYDQKEIDQVKSVWQKLNETTLDAFDAGQSSNILCWPNSVSQSGQNSIIGHRNNIAKSLMAYLVAYVIIAI